MPKSRRTKIVKPAASKTSVLRNQFLGLLLVAIGVGALIVVVRYFVISLSVPNDVYLIQTSQLIPGAK